jgi:hypothetical protein
MEVKKIVVKYGAHREEKREREKFYFGWEGGVTHPQLYTP